MRGADRIDRRFLFWTARRLYSTRTASPPGPEGPERLLVVRIDERVGNLVTLQSMLDALGAVEGDDVTLSVQDSNSSCLIRQPGDEDCTFVVMPMRL